MTNSYFRVSLNNIRLHETESEERWHQVMFKSVLLLIATTTTVGGVLVTQSTFEKGVIARWFMVGVGLESLVLMSVRKGATYLITSPSPLINR